MISASGSTGFKTAATSSPFPTAPALNISSVPSDPRCVSYHADAFKQAMCGRESPQDQLKILLTLLKVGGFWAGTNDKTYRLFKSYSENNVENY